MKRTSVIVNWIGVVVTRCDQFGWYSDGSCRGSCDWAVSVVGQGLLFVYPKESWIGGSGSGISGKRSCVAPDAGRGEGF